MKKTPAKTVELPQTVKQETGSLTFLQKLTPEDKAAALECVDADGSFIWSLARKFTSSESEAKSAAHEIFTDIWRYLKLENHRTNDDLLRSLIARRRLMKYLQIK